MQDFAWRLSEVAAARQTLISELQKKRGLLAPITT